jgi:hypothetical protein
MRQYSTLSRKGPNAMEALTAPRWWGVGYSSFEYVFFCMFLKLGTYSED